MLKYSLIYNDKLWKLIDKVCHLQEEVLLEDLLREFKVIKSEFIEVLGFLSQFGVNVEVLSDKGIERVIPLSDFKNFNITLNFNLLEWLSFQAHLPVFSGYSHKSFHKTFQKSLERLDSSIPKTELFNVFVGKENKAKSGESFDSDQNFLIEKINFHIKGKNPIEIFKKDGSLDGLLPLRIVYIESNICVIGENLSSGSLEFFPIEDIEKITILYDQVYTAQVSSIEIDEFINALRTVNGSERRLVLKVIDQAQIDLSPQYHFLGKPYITANSEGELIWAAYVEANNDLYEWMYSIKESIEILDPSEIKKTFNDFCQMKIDSFKKVS